MINHHTGSIFIHHTTCVFKKLRISYLRLLAFIIILVIPTYTVLADISPKSDRPPPGTIIVLVAPISPLELINIGWLGSTPTLRLYVQTLLDGKYRLRLRLVSKLPISLQDVKDTIEANIPNETCENKTWSNNDYQLKIDPPGILKATASVTSQFWKCGNIDFIIGTKHYRIKLFKHVTHLERTLTFKLDMPSRKTLSEDDECNNMDAKKDIETCAKNHPSTIDYKDTIKKENNVLQDVSKSYKLPWKVTAAIISLPTLQLKIVDNGVVEGPMIPMLDGSRGKHYFVYEAKTPIMKYSMVKNLLKTATNKGGFCAIGDFDRSFEELKWPQKSFLMDEYLCHSRNIP